MFSILSIVVVGAVTITAAVLWCFIGWPKVLSDHMPEPETLEYELDQARQAWSALCETFANELLRLARWAKGAL